MNALMKKNPELKKRQEKEYDCGPTCFAYCLHMKGITVVSASLYSFLEGTIMRFIGTLPTWFAKKALEYRFNFEDLIYDHNDKEDFLFFLTKEAKLRNPSILLVDSGHWVCVLGFEELTGRFIVNDPASSSTRVTEWTKDTLLRRAHSAINALDFNGYYAFVLQERQEG